MNCTAEDLLKLFSHTPIATAIYTSPDLHITFANKKMLSFWNRDEQILNNTMEACFPENYYKPFISLMKKVWTTGESHSSINTPAQITLSGEYGLYYFDFEYKAITNTEGNTIAIIHTAMDVTSRVSADNTLKETEQHVLSLNKDILDKKNDIENIIIKLQESSTSQTSASDTILRANINEEIIRIIKQEEQLNFALQSAQMGTWTIDFKTKTVSWDKFTHHILGEEIKQDIVFDEVFRHIHPDDREKVALAINNALDAPHKSKVDIVYRSLGSFSNKPKWLHSKGRVYFNNENEPTLLSGTLMDVTNQYRQQEKFEYYHQQLIQREKELRQILDAAEIGIFTYRITTQEIQIDQHAKRLLRYDNNSSLTIENLLTHIHPSCVNNIYNTFYACQQDKNAFDIQIEFVNLDGNTETWIRVLGTVHWDVEIAQDVIYAVLIDITAAKKEEKNKIDFLSIASHELKTPLTSLYAFIQLLLMKGNALDEVQRANYLNLAFTQIKRMQSMIERFLNVSQLNENKLNIRKEHTTLQQLMRQVSDMYSVQSHYTRLNFQDVEDIPLYIDSMKIEEVLNNFINNALKYSPQNYPVHITTSKADDKLYIAVKDFGRGIARENQDQIFEKFYRVNNKENKLVSGFGIGLYICKEIIQLHDGDIGVLSDGNTGCTFWFTLPL